MWRKGMRLVSDNREDYALTDSERAKMTDADITEAERLLRVAAGGHEPYAPAVWPMAVKVLRERLAREASV